MHQIGVAKSAPPCVPPPVQALIAIVGLIPTHIEEEKGKVGEVE